MGDTRWKSDEEKYLSPDGAVSGIHG